MEMMEGASADKADNPQHGGFMMRDDDDDGDHLDHNDTHERTPLRDRRHSDHHHRHHQHSSPPITDAHTHAHLPPHTHTHESATGTRAALTESHSPGAGVHGTPRDEDGDTHTHTHAHGEGDAVDDSERMLLQHRHRSNTHTHTTPTHTHTCARARVRWGGEAQGVCACVGMCARMVCVCRRNPFHAGPGSPRRLDGVETRNTVIFLCGVMLSNFAYASVPTCMALFATSRFPREHAVTLLSALTGSVALAQAFASVLVGRLVVHIPAHKLMSLGVWGLGMIVSGLMLLEAACGGTVHQPGAYNPFLIFPIYTCIGGCLGVLHLCRRVIPKDIVGASTAKLQRLDATVHIFGHVSSTAAAFLTMPFITRFGHVYALLLLPFVCLLSGFLYRSLDVGDLQHTRQGFQHLSGVELQELDGSMARVVADSGVWSPNIDDQEFSYSSKSSSTSSDGSLEGAGHSRRKANLCSSLKVGAQILFSSRNFSWLIFGYTLPHILHRLLEGIMFPAFAKTMLRNGAYTGILHGFASFGELLGGLFVLCIGHAIPTPLPWVRWDSITLVCFWVFATHTPPPNPTLFLRVVGPMVAFVTGGWAAGDVSLLAYLQSQLDTHTDTHTHDNDHVNRLSAILGFLYSTYTVFYLIVSLFIGRVMDFYIHNGVPWKGFALIAGVFPTVCGVVMMASSFVPPGSWAWNPRV